MRYGFVMDVQAPAEFYDALHAEVVRRTDGRVDGLLVHVGWATATGFRVLEVWESREQCDRYNAEVVGPALAQASGGRAPEQEPALEEFDPRGLVLPQHAAVLV